MPHLPSVRRSQPGPWPNRSVGDPLSRAVGRCAGIGAPPIARFGTLTHIQDHAAAQSRMQQMVSSPRSTQEAPHS
eukprot:scaffold1885_cov402-Prasinococcus_capsulatus_cf.AAC.18